NRPLLDLLCVLRRGPSPPRHDFVRDVHVVHGALLFGAVVTCDSGTSWFGSAFDHHSFLRPGSPSSGAYELSGGLGQLGTQWWWRIVPHQRVLLRVGGA